MQILNKFQHLALPRTNQSCLSPDWRTYHYSSPRCKTSPLIVINSALNQRSRTYFPWCLDSLQSSFSSDSAQPVTAQNPSAELLTANLSPVRIPPSIDLSESAHLHDYHEVSVSTLSAPLATIHHPPAEFLNVNLPPVRTPPRTEHSGSAPPYFPTGWLVGCKGFNGAKSP